MKNGKEIAVESLTPDRLEDFLGFFETAIPESEWGHCCYCAAFCAKDNSGEHGMEKPEIRKAAAVRYIREGSLRGYLAYEGGRVIGWCGANDRNACRKCFGVRWIVGAELPETDERGLSVFCFEIAPDMRGMGVASLLLDRVISDARKGRYAFVEAYPARKAEGEQENYAGPAALYEKAGFEKTEEAENCFIFRKRTDFKAD